MPDETITLPIDPEAAKAYNAATPGDQRKIQALISFWLRELATAPPDLKKLMDDVSQKARDQGMTPEILDSLLKGASGQGNFGQSQIAARATEPIRRRAGDSAFRRHDRAPDLPSARNGRP